VKEKKCEVMKMGQWMGPTGVCDREKKKSGVWVPRVCERKKCEWSVGPTGVEREKKSEWSVAKRPDT